MLKHDRSMMTKNHSKKVKTGLALDRDVVAALDGMVEKLAAFGLTRSEIADAILRDFLESTPSYESKAMEFVARYRIRRP